MDFREAIRKNNTRTKFVIGSYIFIMLIVGLLADVAVRPIYNGSLTSNLIGYIQFQKLPYITFGILALTIIGILIISKFGHKLMLTGSEYKLLEPEQGIMAFEEKQVFNMIEEMAISANLGYIPKAYIMETDEMNAFAAGWNRDNALVGVTRGLINKLNRDETQAVVAHEIGHIIHGDSKLTLYVGILANVILTFTNIFANIAIIFTGRGNEASNKARLLLIVLNLILPIVTQVLYLYLSRTREYMADAAAVQLTGDNQSMINALRKISGNHEEHAEEDKESTTKVGEHYRSAAYIFSKGDSVFSTHPSIENRIKKLNGE